MMSISHVSGLAVGAGSPADPAGTFELNLPRREGGTTVLAVSGELDLHRAPALERALAEALEPDAAQERRRVVVDMRAVTFLDSTTLALLLAAHGRQQARGGEVLILVGPQTPTSVFKVTGFDRLLTIKHLRDRTAT